VEIVAFLIRAMGVGLFSGLLVTLYRYVLMVVENFRQHMTFGIGVIIGIPLVTFILGKIMKHHAYVRGGGVAVVKGLIKGTISSHWANDVIFKFISGIFSLLAGLSMGIEGPAVQLGAQMAEGVVGEENSEEERKYLITAGGAAGFAAAFGAPFSAAIFAIEEFGKKISEKILVAIFVAATIGGVIAKIVFPEKYFFHPEIKSEFPISSYLLIVILGFVIVCIGKLYIIISDKFSDFHTKINIPMEWKPLLPVIVGVIATFFLYEITGGGHHMSETVLKENLTLKLLLVLLVLKFLFSLFCSSSGIPGGVFIPIISIGLIAGKIFGIISVELFGLPMYLENYFAVAGFVAALTTLIRIPLTSLALSVETTGTLDLLIPAFIAATSAHIFARIFKIESIYDTGYKKLMGTKMTEETKYENIGSEI
jgi:H+/Cl- antiporter ClcA